MALAGTGVLAIWNGIAEEAESDFIAWHIGEHIPERVAVPGFLRGRRYVAERGTPKYFNFYETDTPDALVSRAYLARLNAPSDWTKRVVRHFRDTSRTVCSVAASHGLGDGAYVATLRLAARGARSDFLGAIRDAVMQPLGQAPSIVALHLLEGQGGGGNLSTAEKALRAQPDQVADWILLVEAVDAAPLEAALAEHASQARLAEIASGYDAVRDCGIYRLQYGLAKHQIA
ncbi:MAG: hypothetical protein Q8S58_00890 [Bosea sp. (in: a-proteobacteria)]|uniref:DUF4286 family protein n=1 Tax=Bosea sp. (in: a-proteobacteria) TaxID=1871050 RepID=UPI002736BEC6|nr:DUF4286 family protein [Bosea sp. (in: a-proteobacteria)]MDP3256249.1 hypothetical protein [Bosea sp. (in: a-proteobacteria)]MDP3317658.1 hypothetical protein [Bosea sp. (in: a-proteobacteria)]